MLACLLRLSLFFSHPLALRSTVSMGSVGLITRFGRFYHAVDPGLHYVTPIVESLRVVDIRLQVS